MYEGSAAELRNSWEGQRKLCSSVFSLANGVGKSKSISAGEKVARFHENVRMSKEARLLGTADTSL